MSNEVDDKEQDDLDIIESDSNQEDGEKNTEEDSVHKSQLDLQVLKELKLYKKAVKFIKKFI